MSSSSFLWLMKHYLTYCFHRYCNSALNIKLFLNSEASRGCAEQSNCLTNEEENKLGSRNAHILMWKFTCIEVIVAQLAIHLLWHWYNFIAVVWFLQYELPYWSFESDFFYACKSTLPWLFYVAISSQHFLLCSLIL